MNFLASHQSVQSNTETQRGIDVRLTAATARYNEAQAAYHRDPSTLDELTAAAEELRRLRSQPMKSLASAVAPKRFINLGE